MLELDLLLEPFAKECFETLSDEQQQLYQQLLSCEDQDLYRWLLQCQAPSEPALEPIIQLILAYTRDSA